MIKEVNDIWIRDLINIEGDKQAKVLYVPHKYYDKLRALLNLSVDFEINKFNQMKQDFNRIDNVVIDEIEESFFSEIANIISWLPFERSYRPHNILGDIKTELHNTLRSAWHRIIEEEIILVTRNGWYKKNPEINYNFYTKKV